MPSDDGTLYVLTLPGEVPMRFGHRHAGELVEFQRGEGAQDRLMPEKTETPYTCGGCGDRITVSAPGR